MATTSNYGAQTPSTTTKSTGTTESAVTRKPATRTRKPATASARTTSARTPSQRKAASARGQKAAATRKRNTAARSATSTRASAQRTVRSAEGTAQAAGSATAAESRVLLTQAQQIAERAVLVPVGASLVARDNLVSSVKGLRTKVQTRASVERELKRYERRGATARNRFERQVRRPDEVRARAASAS